MYFSKYILHVSIERNTRESLGELQKAAVQFTVKARAVQTKKKSWSDGYNDYLLHRGNHFEDS